MDLSLRNLFRWDIEQRCLEEGGCVFVDASLRSSAAILLRSCLSQCAARRNSPCSAMFQCWLCPEHDLKRLPWRLFLRALLVSVNESGSKDTSVFRRALHRSCVLAYCAAQAGDGMAPRGKGPVSKEGGALVSLRWWQCGRRPVCVHPAGAELEDSVTWRIGESAAWHQQHITVVKPPQEEEEPSADQLQALLKTTRANEFRTWIPTSDSSYISEELPGLKNLQQWLSSWWVFEVAAIMLNLSSMAMLALYEKAIERLTRLWPSAWHLVAAADDKCRAEPIKRIKRSREVDRVSRKDVPDVYSEQEPWSIYFRLDAAFGDGTGSSSSGGVGDGGLRGASLAPDENMPALHLPSGQLALEPQLEWSRTNRRKQHEATEQRRAAKVQELQQMRAWRQARVHTRGSAKNSPDKVTSMAMTARRASRTCTRRSETARSSTTAGTTCRTWAKTWLRSYQTREYLTREPVQDRRLWWVCPHLSPGCGASYEVRFTVSEALQRCGCRLPHCCPRVCPMSSCSPWLVWARARSRRSSGDREGIREGPRVEEATPVPVHLLGRRHLLPRAGQFGALWGKSAEGSGGFGFRGPVAESGGAVPPGSDSQGSEHLACPSASALCGESLPAKLVLSLSRVHRERSCEGRCQQILSLRFSRVRPRAFLAGWLDQHKLPWSLSRVHPRAL